MKIKVKKKDIELIKDFLGATSCADISDFVELHRLTFDTQELDQALYRLYMAMDNRLN